VVEHTFGVLQLDKAIPNPVQICTFIKFTNGQQGDTCRLGRLDNQLTARLLLLQEP
jgi:hypothetical protein